MSQRIEVIQPHRGSRVRPEDGAVVTVNLEVGVVDVASLSDDERAWLPEAVARGLVRPVEEI